MSGKMLPLLAVLTIAHFAAPAASAGVIVFDNTADSISAADAFNVPLFASFSTGSNTGPITNLELALGVSVPSDGGIVNVALYADSATCTGSPVNTTCPGTFLANLGTLADSSLGGLENLSVSTSPTLAASTRYWLVLSQTSGSADWDFTASASGTGVSGEFWGHGGLEEPNTSPGDTIMQVTLGTSAVPEPGALALSGFGLGVLAFAARRRRKTS
jgi:PEP-CTERM motif